MPDYKLDIEVRVAIKPVNPKVGTTARGPWERNQRVVKETKSVMLYNATKADVATLAAGGLAAVAEQQALGGKPSKFKQDMGVEQITSTSAQTKAIIDNKGVSTVLTCEFGPTPLIAEGSQVATVSPDVSNDSTFPEFYFNLDSMTQDTFYYYRIKMVSAIGTSYGPLKAFRTIPTP